MILVAYLSFFLLISSVGAAKDGDDDWVHLPNKCEGKAACGAQNGLRGPLRVLQQIEKSYCSICVYIIHVVYVLSIISTLCGFTLFVEEVALKQDYVKH